MLMIQNGLPLLLQEQLKCFSKAGLSKNDIDIWEINEAFSVVTMAAIDDFNIDQTTVNIHGGAVAIGHPIGASGARILVTLINALDRLGKTIGLATLCGGGEASAMIIEKIMIKNKAIDWDNLGLMLRKLVVCMWLLMVLVASGSLKV